MALLGLPLGAVQAGTMGQEPFQWGRGGRRMTPEDIARQREMAAAQMQQGADYSPIGHWTQGLARASQGILGGLSLRQANKASDANMAESQSISQMLIGGEGGAPSQDAVLQALVNPNVSKEVRGLAEMQWKRMNPEPVDPVIQRANNGDIIGVNPRTGEVMFKNVDPNPKPVLDWITARNPDGTQTLIPMGVDGPVNQSGYGAPTAPVGKLTPIEPTTDNTLAPQLGDNGLPARLNREQYMATVNAMGKEATDAWIARNNIRVQQ